MWSRKVSKAACKSLVSIPRTTSKLTFFLPSTRGLASASPAHLRGGRCDSRPGCRRHLHPHTPSSRADLSNSKEVMTRKTKRSKSIFSVFASALPLRHLADPDLTHNPCCQLYLASAVPMATGRRKSNPPSPTRQSTPPHPHLHRTPRRDMQLKIMLRTPRTKKTRTKPGLAQLIPVSPPAVER